MGKDFYNNSVSKENENIWHSQNFLRNPSFVESLVSLSNINQDDTVIEIGPGKGIITKELAKKAGNVIAIELDDNLAKELIHRFSFVENIEIIRDDFLRWQTPNYPYKVFANVPFEYTSRIIHKLLNSKTPPTDSYLILQDLAAKRYIGEPVARNTQISTTLQPFYNIEILANIDKNQYSPRPSVDTVLTRFVRKEKALIDPRETQRYRDFVMYGYNQWQPTLLDAYKEIFSYKQKKRLSEELGISGKKPSELTSEQWIKLFQAYMKFVPESSKHIVDGSEKRLQSKQKGMEKRYRTRR